jgi:hypothetical protein
MRHGESACDNFVGLDINRNATIMPMFTPAIDDIGLRTRGNLMSLTIDHRQAVQMAMVLTSQCGKASTALSDLIEPELAADHGNLVALVGAVPKVHR